MHIDELAVAVCDVRHLTFISCHFAVTIDGRQPACSRVFLMSLRDC